MVRVLLLFGSCWVAWRIWIQICTDRPRDFAKTLQQLSSMTERAAIKVILEV
jgi:hypothetical protein